MAEQKAKLLIKEGRGVGINRERRGSTGNIEQFLKRKREIEIEGREEGRGEGIQFAFKKGRKTQRLPQKGEKKGRIEGMEKVDW